MSLFAQNSEILSYAVNPNIYLSILLHSKISFVERKRQKLKAQRKKQKKREEVDPEDFRVQKEASFHKREARRTERKKKAYACDDSVSTPRTKKCKSIAAKITLRYFF